MVRYFVDTGRDYAGVSWWFSLLSSGTQTGKGLKTTQTTFLFLEMERWVGWKVIGLAKLFLIPFSSFDWR